jgi:hypothetical protein
MAMMRARGRKRRPMILVAGLAMGLTLWPGQALAGRRGADVKITLLDGGRVSGELIAVRADTIIVKSLIRESTVAVADIDSIIVVAAAGGSTLLPQLGIYAGIALGVVAAGAYGRWYHDKYDGIPIWAWPLGIVGGAWLGSAAGGWLSNKGDRDKLYPIKGQSPEAVARVMARLKRKARLRVVY